MHVFLDTNVFLQCKPLEQLPWEDLGIGGNISVYLAPTVVAEIDSKKQDGRLGEIARTAGRIVRKIFQQQDAPFVVRAKDRDISVFRAQISRYKWDDYPELDPQDSDSKIVVEILNCSEVSDDQKVVVSQDVSILSLASKYGLKAVAIDDKWLRPKDASKHEKELLQLRERVAFFERTQPALSAVIDADIANHVAYAVGPLNAQERAELTAGLLNRNPAPQHDELSVLSAINWQGKQTSEAAYAEFKNKTIPLFADSLPRILEKTLGQLRFSIGLSNDGDLIADEVVVSVKVSGGWISELPCDYNVSGPSPKVPSLFFSIPTLPEIPALLELDDEFVLTKNAIEAAVVELRCPTFHVGAKLSQKFVLFVDPRGDERVSLTLRVSVANLKWAINQVLVIHPIVKSVSASDIMDVFNGCPKVETPVIKEISELFSNSDSMGKVRLSGLD